MTALGTITCNANYGALTYQLPIWAASNALATPGLSRPVLAVKALALSVWQATTSGVSPGKMNYCTQKRAAATWRATDRTAVTAYAENGRIHGTITKSGVAVANCKVSIHWRPSMIEIGATMTDAAGHYAFGYDGFPSLALDPTDSGNYAVIARDPANTYDAVAHDMLTAAT